MENSEKELNEEIQNPQTEQLPGRSQEDGQMVEVSQQAAWAGPLPPPAILEQFSAVVDDGAERIFKAWETETAHRQKEESRELTIYAADALLGKIFAFVFVLSALAISLWAALSGAEWFATILGGGTIASVVWAFVRTNRGGSNNGGNGG